jgi:hypothetical protein
MVALLSAYFDEGGGTSENSPLTCSAAYVFREQGLRQFFKEWEPYVREKGLLYKGNPCFHSTDHCRQHNSAEIFETLRQLISRTSEKGFVRFAMKDALKEFNNKSQVAGVSGDDYSLLTLATMEAVAEYAKVRGCEVVYYIENGPNDDLRNMVRQIEMSDSLREHYAVSNISFPRKADAIQLQSADLLAWSFHRFDDSERIPVAGIDPAPGIADLREWVSWYKGHDLMGYSFSGLEVRTMVNRFNGLKMPELGGRLNDGK